MVSHILMFRYQFYFPNDPVISKLKEKCQEYHRNLINRRKIKEKYGN